MRASITLSRRRFLTLPRFERLITRKRGPIIIHSIYERIGRILSRQIVCTGFCRIALPTRSTSFNGCQGVGTRRLKRCTIPELIRTFVRGCISSGWGLRRSLRSVIVLFGFNDEFRLGGSGLSACVSIGEIVLVNGIKRSPQIGCFSAKSTITAFPLTAASHKCALRGNARVPREAR